MLNLIKYIYWRYFKTSVEYARHIGVIVGYGTTISIREWSSEPYLIKIGNHVQITKNVQFFTHGGGHVVRKSHPNFDVFGKIIVEDDVYIGANALIMPGVTIGKGSLVASGSVVTKSIPPYSVVAGHPAKIICTTTDYYNKNKQYDVHSYGMSKNEKRNYLLSLSNDKFIIK